MEKFDSYIDNNNYDNLDLYYKYCLNELSIPKDIKFKILYSKNLLFKISVNDDIYILYKPLILTFIFNKVKKSIKIYNRAHLLFIIKKYYLSDDLIKNNKNKIIKLIDYYNKGEIEFGIEKEVIQENSNLPNNIDSLDFKFPQNCFYYDIYCNKIDNFVFIETEKRLDNIDYILNFFKEKNINYFTGKRGIGKTTTILDIFYNNTNYNFIYINLKFFENTEIKKKKKLEVMTFEIRNLFRNNKLKNTDNKIDENYIKSVEILISKITDENLIDNKINNIILCLQKIIYFFENYENELNNKYLPKIKLYLSKLNLNNPELDINNLNNFEDLLKNKKKFQINIMNILIKNIFNIQYNNFLSQMKFYINEIEKNLFFYIEKLINNYNTLDKKFFVILDQFKNTKTQKQYIEKIYQQNSNNNKINILICSSIDDEEVRNEIIKEESIYKIIDSNIITLDDIINKYSDVFNNFSDKKKEYIYLFKSNTKEIFECFNKKENELNIYIKIKINKIKNYLNIFLKTRERRYYTFFINRKINFYFNEKDYRFLLNYISFKYFNFNEYDNNKIDKKYILSLDQEEFNNNNDKYYKFDYAIPLVENAIIEMNKLEDYEIENYILEGNKGVCKGIFFEEFIKNNIKNKILFPIKDLIIDEFVEIWSINKKPKKDANIHGLYKDKFKKNMIYFVDFRNQIEKDFDCCIFDLKKNKIILIQITINKNIKSLVFNRDYLEKESKNILDFVSNEKFFDEDVNIETICFFFIFLKLNSENNKEDKSKFFSHKKKYKKYVEKYNSNLLSMNKKCDEENLVYYNYEFENNNIQQIEYEEENLIIYKKNRDIENSKKNSNLIIKKKNYNEILKDYLECFNYSLLEVEVEGNIKIILNYYNKKFKLNEKKIFYEKDTSYIYEEIEFNLRYNTNCFALENYNDNKNKTNIYGVIYYNNEIIHLKLENKKISEIKTSNKNFNKFILYYVGEKENIMNKYIYNQMNKIMGDISKNLKNMNIKK